MQNEDHALREALKQLVHCAGEVSKLGATPGTQWVRLTGALISARAALSATPTPGAACPADGNLLSEDGVCGFCGNAPVAHAADQRRPQVSALPVSSAPIDNEALVEEAAMAIRFSTNPLDGDPIGVMIHNYDFLDGEQPLEAQIAEVDEVCRAMARAALSATPTPAPTYDDEISDEYLDTLQASINQGARRSSARFKLTSVAPAPIDNEALVEEVRAGLQDWFQRETGFQTIEDEGERVSAYYGGWIYIDIAKLARAVLALPSIATRAQSAPVQSALVEETIRALSNARRILAFQPHPLTAAHADEKRGALAEIDATLAKLKEGRA